MMIGISNLPATYDGALIASLDTEGNVTAEFALDEQGVMDMLCLSDGTLLVCGCDAALGDDWHYGNIYLRTPEGVWTKKRTLENVIHVWGACESGGKIYAATGAHIGDNATWEARVYVSGDKGDTWTHHYVCYYRVYDVFALGGVLYATAWDYPAYRLYSSVDDGVSWGIVADIVPEPRIRMVEFDGHVVGAVSGGASIWATAGDGVTTIALPSYAGTIQQYNMHSLAVSGGVLYALTDSKIIKRDSLAGAWVYHCDLGEAAVSIAVFAGVGLIVGTANGRLLQVPF